MAQIGSPSAGWYTDPSGQHRARYWDGASWTEQVRDDLTDPTDTTGTTPATPGTHAAAATVAGVAEAVAAVAANDLRPVEPEPPLVVDLGTDVPWGGLPGGNGNGQVTDPFAPMAAVPTVPAVYEPAPYEPAAEPVADPFAPVAPSFDSAAPAPAPEPEPSGPAVGWYPDPAARHQARLWDGTRWTERVADNGVEGFDPLPGATSTTTVDPAVGAWSSELQGTEAAAGPDGLPLTAGQISLASLPQTDDVAGGSSRTHVRPSVKVRVSGGFVLGGAIALLVGSATTWMQVTGPRVGDEWTETGVDLGDGRITIILGLLLAVLGVAIITGRMFGGTKIAAMGSLVAGAAALAVTAVDIADVADRASRLGVPPGAVSNVGTGLWLAFVGALFAVGGGLMAFANRQ